MVVIRRQGFIGQKLIEKGLIDKNTLERVLEIQKKSGGKLLDLLITSGYVTAEDAIEVVSTHLGIKGKMITLKEIRVDAFNLFTEKYMKEKEFIAYSISGNKLNIVMENPKNLILIDELQRKSGLNIKVYYCTKSIILETIDQMVELKAKNSSKK